MGRWEGGKVGDDKEFIIRHPRTIERHKGNSRGQAKEMKHRAMRKQSTVPGRA
jgi:hypothetical protein